MSLPTFPRIQSGRELRKLASQLARKHSNRKQFCEMIPSRLVLEIKLGPLIMFIDTMRFIPLVDVRVFVLYWISELPL